MMNQFDFLDEEEDDEEEASWQDSYSDLITDLLAVFVILFSFAMMNQAAVTYAAQNANNVNILPGGSPSLGIDSAVVAQVDAQSAESHFNELYESIKGYIDDEGLHRELSVEKLGNDQILLRMEASVAFEPKRAEITAEAEPILQQISDLFVQYEDAIKIVRIEGHTDNLPMHNHEFDSNWELSASRAVNVLRRLAEMSQLNPKQFSAVGYSEFYPIASNETPEGRAENRRVDFFIEAIDSPSEE